MLLKKYNSERITTRLEKTMEKMVTRPDIDELLESSVSMCRLTQLIPHQTFTLSKKWHTFMPPVLKFKLDKQVQKYVTSDFRSEIASLMKRGHKEQFSGINVVKGKNITYGYSLIELIHGIVKNQDALLKTSANLPFLENACCNDKEVNPLYYFINKDETIKQITYSVNKNQDWL